jgi:hypothetical protein
MIVLLIKIFIGEISCVDRFSSGAIVVGEIPSLYHEVWDYSVESTPFKAESLLMSAKFSEVCCGKGSTLIKKIEDESAGCLTADGDVHKYF